MVGGKLADRVIEIDQQRPVRLYETAIKFALRKGHLGPVDFQAGHVVLAAGD
jgi:hypothetical protein